MNGWEKMMVDGDRTCYGGGSSDNSNPPSESSLHQEKPTPSISEVGSTTVHGYSDTRAKHEGVENSGRGGCGCLVPLVLGITSLVSSSVGIYQTVKYLTN